MGPLVYDITNAAAAGDLEFPLFKIAAIVTMRRKVPAKPMLSFVTGP